MLLSTILEAVSYVPGLAAIAAAVAVIGAAIGIGRIGQSAMEAMARQPEAADGIRSGMIIGQPALAKMTKTMRKAMSIHITSPLSGRNKSIFYLFNR